MSDMLLAKSNLPPNWIDAGPGEAYIIRDSLLEVFDLSCYELPKVKGLYEYPDPKGFKPLVELLENRYKYPVVITNGAKQALSAIFFALKKLGKQSVGVRKPYWCLLKPLAEVNGLEFISDKDKEFESYLCVAPENPSNFMPTLEVLKQDEANLKENNIPLIHDGAYYTHTYLPASHSLDVIGDVQIYSASKMLGLSGIRVGWCVCKNKDFYKLIQEYIEMMTVGVSTISQVFLYDLINRMNGYPSLTEKFEGLSSNALIESKKIVKGIDPKVLEVPNDFENSIGMFLFAKKGPKLDLVKSKVNIIDGTHFGMPGYVRINLAFNKDKMTEIVKRLNQC